jgi:hypothetical protein
MALAEQFSSVHSLRMSLAKQAIRAKVTPQAKAAWRDMAKAVATQMKTINRVVSHVAKCDLCVKDL